MVCVFNGGESYAFPVILHSLYQST